MGIRLEHENYATGVSMREMPTQVGSTGNNGGAEGLPEMQESVLEHAAPEASQNQGLAGRLADGDYRKNGDSVNTGTVRKTDKKAGIALEALNALGLALTDHSHRWSTHERWLYMRARGWLISFGACDEGSAASG
jgi:hypothetical protein